MAGFLGLPVYLLVVHLSLVAGDEVCSYGFYYRYCEGDKYCCNYNTECCSPTPTGTIVGSVIGSLVFVALVVGVVICVCKKKGHQGSVVSAYPHSSTTGVITVSTVQNQYLGQQYGPPQPAFGNHQFTPTYQPGYPGMTWQPPHQIPQNHPNTYYPPQNPAHPRH